MKKQIVLASDAPKLSKAIVYNRRRVNFFLGILVAAAAIEILHVLTRNNPVVGPFFTDMRILAIGASVGAVVGLVGCILYYLVRKK